jgi:hypothetical protein
VATTDTPGRGDPSSSVTVPMILPTGSWAVRALQDKKKPTSRKPDSKHLFMAYLFSGMANRFPDPNPIADGISFFG